MDDLTRRAFEGDRCRTARRLTAAIADIREQLLSIEDAINSGAPLAATRSRQLVTRAGEVASTAGALDTLVEWGNLFDSQGASEAESGSPEKTKDGA